MTRSGLILALVLAPCAAVGAADPVSISHEFDAAYSYVGGARTRGAGMVHGTVDEHSADVKYVLSPQITNNLLLRLGVEWQRFSFGVPDRAPVPDVLQQISAVIGVDYQIADQWLVRAEVQPGVYSDFRDVGWRDVDAPLVLGAVYLADEDLQWIFGLRVDVRSQYPVLPAVGVRWKFADQWTLNAVLPKPRLEYDVNDKVLLYCGADLEAGTYRVGEQFGRDRGEPALNGELVDFSEIRLGPGCSWKATPDVTIEVDAGYVPYRSFDFFDPTIVYRSHTAPYAQIACHARF